MFVYWHIYLLVKFVKSTYLSRKKNNDSFINYTDIHAFGVALQGFFLFEHVQTHMSWYIESNSDQIRLSKGLQDTP